MKFESYAQFVSSAALRLGVAAAPTELLGDGDDGFAFGLADGRVMKVSCSVDETAAALAVQAAAAQTGAVKGTPRIDAVAWTRDTPPSFSGGCRVIVREDAPDYDCPFDLRKWADALYSLMDPRTDDAAKALLVDQMRLHDPVMYPKLREVWAALSDLKMRCGISQVWDVCNSNLGVGADGKLVVRDLSRCAPPVWARQIAAAKAFLELPGCDPVPSPSPR